jgi:hypothetical protein
VSDTSDIPEPVRRFLAERIESVSLLDALLLLRATPDKAWTGAELGRALVTGERPASAQLEQLRGQKLVVLQDDAYRYSPSPGDGRTIDTLAECYARRRHTVIGLIYGGGRGRAPQSLADAFRIRREES